MYKAQFQNVHLVQRNNQCSQPFLIHLSPHKGDLKSRWSGILILVCLTNFHFLPHLFSCVHPIGWYRIIWSTMIDVSDISCQEVTCCISKQVMACGLLLGEGRRWQPVGGDLHHQDQGGEGGHQAVAAHSKYCSEIDFLQN